MTVNRTSRDCRHTPHRAEQSALQFALLLLGLAWSATAFSQKLMLQEEGYWQLQVEVTSLDASAPQGSAGSYRFGKFSCGGTLSYKGEDAQSGELIFQQHLSYGRCTKGCEIWVAPTLDGYREMCSARQAGQGRLLSTPEQAGNLLALRKSLRQASYRSRFEAIDSPEKADQFVADFSADDPDGLVAQARNKAAELRLAEYRSAFAGLETPENAEEFVTRYQDADPDGLIPQVKLKLDEWRLRDYRSDFATIETIEQAEQFIARHGSQDPDLLIPKAQARLAELKLARYEADFAAIADAASASSFIEAYAKHDPAKRLPEARKKLQAYQLAEQVRSLEAIQSIADAEAHIEQYSASDAAKTVGKAKLKLAALKKEEQARIAAEEKKKAQEQARIKGMVNRFVTWREPLKVDTNDCFTVLFVRQCMWVTYHFDLRAKVQEVDTDAGNFVTSVVDVKLFIPSMRSIAYLQYQNKAQQLAKSQWLGQPMVKPIQELMPAQ